MTPTNGKENWSEQHLQLTIAIAKQKKERYLT